MNFSALFIVASMLIVATLQQENVTVAPTSAPSSTGTTLAPASNGTSTSAPASNGTSVTTPAPASNETTTLPYSTTTQSASSISIFFSTIAAFYCMF